MNKRAYDRYIFQIAEQGSLTKAAACLGISQPALSSGLTNLENELGFKIFHRRSVPITFTPEGEIYFNYIKRLQVLTDDFQQRIDAYRQESENAVTIGGPVAYVESLVADAMIEFRKENPHYKVSLKCSPLSEVIEMASKGEINCFVCTCEELPVRFEKRLIKKEKIYLCIPRGNQLNEKIMNYQTEPGKNGTYFDYSVLDGEEFIFLEENQPLQIQMKAFLEEHGISPVNKVTVNQVSTAVNLAIRGVGICFASEAALSGNVDLNNVCIYALPESISGRSIYIAYDKELYMSAACKELTEYLVNDKTDSDFKDYFLSKR